MIQDQDDAGASAPVSAALTARAVDLHKQHLFAEALPLYRHARILDPGDPAGMHFQGLVEIRIGDMPHGLVLLARSRRLSPDQPGLTENIANILPVIWARTSPTLPTPFWDCATVAATAALQPPGDFLTRLRTRVSERWQTVAFAHYRDGRMDEAHALLKPVTETIDDDLCLLNLYAVVQRRRGNLGDAFNILKTCYRISPSDDMVMLNLASVLQEIGHQEAALDCCQTLAHIALDHFNGFRLEKAESICRNLVHLVPTLRNPWIILGLTLSRLGRQEEAAATMATAIRVDPGYVPPYTFYGDALRLSGHVEKAEHAYRQAAALDPMSAEAIGGVGLACLDQEREEEARRLLERSQWLKSQISSTSSALSCLRLRQSAPAGTRFPRRARSGRGVLSVSSLNSYGRLAHTFYDYISTRIYAEKYGLEVETPEWAGALLFDLDDPLMSKPQRSILLDHDGFRARFRDGLLHDTPDPIQGVDVFLGWPVMELTEIAAHRTMVQSWMRPRALWDPWLRPAVDRLDAMGETIVAVHIRRTDRSLEGGVDFPAYRAWLGQMWDTLHRPVLLVATDDPSVLPEFAPFAPHTLRSLAEPWKGLEHLQDFHLLMNADVVALSYGGFARLAAAFGTRARLVVEPDRATGEFRRVTVWE